MKRLDFIGITFGSILAIFAPKKAEAFPLPAGSAPNLNPKTRLPQPASPNPNLTPEHEEAINQIMKCSMAFEGHPVTDNPYHCYWVYWEGPLNGWVEVETNLDLPSLAFLLPSTRYKKPTFGETAGARRYVLSDKARHCAQESPDGRYFLGTIEVLLGSEGCSFSMPIFPQTPPNP